MNSSDTHRYELSRRATIDALGLLERENNELFSSVVNLVADATRAPACLFAVVYRDRQHFVARRGIEQPDALRERSILADAIVADEPLFVVDDLAADARHAPLGVDIGGQPVRFCAGVVIHAPNGLPVGTVSVLDTRPRRLDESLRDRLTDARILMEAALELHQESTRDHLTGLINRRHFEELLDREWRRARRRNQPLGLLMIDIDRFKAYNDRFGHPDGDDALRRVAHAIRGRLRRPGDVAARYGGEEFTVMLPDTPPAAVADVAEQIRAAVQALGIPHPGTEAGVVTVSVGAAVATRPEDFEAGHAALLERADAALYHAKDSGRNRCHLDGDPDRAIA